MKKLTLLSSLLLICFRTYSAEVDTVKVYSPAMDKEVKTVVILPDAYADQSKTFPVVYLLHGYGDTYAGWVDKAPEIKALADQYELIIVCPDGGKSSWYWDSPVDSGMRYETFVAKELVTWVDQGFRTKATRLGRAITGLSMGGHGALYIALKNQDVFGAAGSTAGGVDIRPFPKNWDMEMRLGSYAKYPERWNQHTVMGMLHLLQPAALEIIIDCGTADFFNQVNQELHQKLVYLNIDHTFISQPGAHNWAYWQKSIPFQLLFMHRFFERPKA